MAEARVERRLAAIFAADVAGYSRLMGADEEGTLRQLKAHRRGLIDPKITEHRGRIVKTTGDGMLVEFVSVVDAVRCAVDIQRGMAERNARVPADKRIRFRIGINVGDIIVDGDDIYGDGVNVAARLEALANPGGICVSRNVYDQVLDKLNFAFEDMGEHMVKNIARPIAVYRVSLAAHMPKALGGKADGLGRWRVRKVAGATAVALLLLIGWGGYVLVQNILTTEHAVQERQAELKGVEVREAKAAAEAEAKRKAEQAEQERLAALGTEEVRKRTQSEARARYYRLVKGNTDFNAGDYDGAIATYSEVIRFDAKNPLAFSSRGVAYRNKGDNDRAIADFNEVIRLEPKNPQAFDNRGTAYLSKGDKDRAIADYNEAIRLYPNYAVAFYNRGNAYLSKGDKDRAIADFNEGIRLDAKNPLAFSGRGVAYASKGDNDRAIADFNEAIRLKPKNPRAFDNRGNAYLSKGDNDRAIADYNEAIRLGAKDHRVFFNRGVAYRNKGDNDRAIADYNEAIRLYPNYAVAFYNRSVAYKDKGDNDRAIADYKEAIRLDPLVRFSTFGSSVKRATAP